MSRSYREPYVVDGYGSRWKQYAKNRHNRKIRRKSVYEDVPDGGAHKKMGVNQWDICDYKWREEKPKSDWVHGDNIIETYEEILERYNKLKRK